MWIMALVHGLVIVAKEPHVFKVTGDSDYGRGPFLACGNPNTYFHGLDVPAPLGAGSCHSTNSIAGYMVWA